MTLVPFANSAYLDCLVRKLGEELEEKLRFLLVTGDTFCFLTDFFLLEEDEDADDDGAFLFDDDDDTCSFELFLFVDDLYVELFKKVFKSVFEVVEEEDDDDEEVEEDDEDDEDGGEGGGDFFSSHPNFQLW